MVDVFRSARSGAHDAADIARELMGALEVPPPAMVLFFSPTRPGIAVAKHIREAWPNTQLIGCSTAGEIATRYAESNSVVAGALGTDVVRRCAVALADFSKGVEQGMTAALDELEAEFGALASLDPTRHVGIIELDSTHGDEELAHVVLGNRAPLLQFVGGSAGDELAFKNTPVVVGERATSHGCSLMLLEVGRPFKVVKSCHFEATDVKFTVTKANRRILAELDGRPAAEVYAKHIGVSSPAELTLENLFPSPIGVMIDGEPWVRCAVPPLHLDGAITLGCEVPEGATVHFLRPRMDLQSHLRSVLAGVRQELGTIQGAIISDCVARRMELDGTGTRRAYGELFDFPTAGYHTHGESWLGHMHQTLTGLFFG